MKNNLEIITTADGKHMLIDGFDTIKKGSKVINKNGRGLIRTAIQNGSLGYLTMDGVAFLYFRENIHRRFVKYITKRDLKKLVPTRKYKTDNWSNPDSFRI